MQYKLIVVLDEPILYSTFRSIKREMESDCGALLVAGYTSEIVTPERGVTIERLEIELEELDDVRRIAGALLFIEDDEEEWSQEELDRAFQNINSNY